VYARVVTNQIQPGKLGAVLAMPPNRETYELTVLA